MAQINRTSKNADQAGGSQGGDKLYTKAHITGFSAHAVTVSGVVLSGPHKGQVLSSATITKESCAFPNLWDNLQATGALLYKLGQPTSAEDGVTVVPRSAMELAKLELKAEFNGQKLTALYPYNGKYFVQLIGMPGRNSKPFSVKEKPPTDTRSWTIPAMMKFNLMWKIVNVMPGHINPFEGWQIKQDYIYSFFVPGEGGYTEVDDTAIIGPEGVWGRKFADHILQMMFHVNNGKWPEQWQHSDNVVPAMLAAIGTGPSSGTVQVEIKDGWVQGGVYALT